MTVLTAKSAGAHYVALGHGNASRDASGKTSIESALATIMAHGDAEQDRAFPTTFEPFADAVSTISIGDLEFENTDRGMTISGQQAIVPGSAMHHTIIAILQKALAAFAAPDRATDENATITKVASPFA
ncbi:MAG: hypothetical protein H6872_05850 [Methylobacteriaceae bacterium]|nr:hypothetical protein [Methylobacteriaceae bacterium]